MQPRKLVFSRKGFDSGSGGGPSPIIDGRPISLPIPAAGGPSRTRYSNIGLGDAVKAASRGRLSGDDFCHHDPFFAHGRCAFGQVGAAQGHLQRQTVGVGDMFLFFGLFADEATGERHHRLFAYLAVEQIIDPAVAPVPPAFAPDHPHFLGSWPASNRVYVGAGRAVRDARRTLRLTLPGGPLSHWRVPRWLAAPSTTLSYHRHADRWGGDRQLRAVSRGQEFVANIAENEAAQRWVRRIVSLIDGGQARSNTAAMP